MKITAIETLIDESLPTLSWVRIHTDEGLVGLGETSKGGQAVSAYLHETVAPYLIGQDPRQIDWHSFRLLNAQFAYKSVGVEMRGNSAVDFALWDILGQAAGMPVYQMLGGRSREKIRVYNTCGGPMYARRHRFHAHAVMTGRSDGLFSDQKYEDLEGFLHHADELALSLKEEGFTGMKIWPFDQFAPKTNGNDISVADLKMGLEPFEKIRKAVGDEMDIMVELHSLWALPAAIKIAKALEPFNPYWYEDPIRMDNLDALADYAHRTNVWVTASETLGSRWSFRDLLEKRAVSVVMYDAAWTGGLSEAKKISTMAEAYQLPVAAHDCTGPVEWWAACHLAMNLPNYLIQECVRAFFKVWYLDFVDTLPEVKDGYLTVPETPGLGVKLLPDFEKRETVTQRWTRA